MKFGEEKGDIDCDGGKKETCNQKSFKVLIPSWVFTTIYFKNFTMVTEH